MENGKMISDGSTNDKQQGDHADQHHFIIWRDRNSDSQSKMADEDQQFIKESLDENESQVFEKFMKAHNCYDLIPTSAKLLVFDTQLGVKKAFFALIYNGLRAAPLWDSQQRQFVGMLTITDFIKILQKYFKSSQDHISELEQHKISTWREELCEYSRPLVSIHPEASLYDGIQLLLKHKVHRLPVVDTLTGNVLYILTHKRILRFLYLYIYELPQPVFMQKSIAELGIGTFTNIASVTYKTPVINAILLFVNKRISALPVVDDEGHILDVYAKFDVFNLAIDKSYNDLNKTIGQTIKEKSERIEDVQTCKATETLGVIMERIVKAEVHRLVIVDAENRVTGIISLSDILNFLVSRDEQS